MIKFIEAENAREAGRRAAEIMAEVIKDAESDARKTTVAATSSHLPIRHIGVDSISSAMVSSDKTEFISVSITPGSTQLTVIPDGPSSLASAIVIPRSPALAAE